MLEAIQDLIGRLHLNHHGPQIAIGFVCPVSKKNHPLQIISGLWAIHACRSCGEIYSNPSDLIVAGVLPPENTVYDFAREEGQAVCVEGQTTLIAAG